MHWSKSLLNSPLSVNRDQLQHHVGRRDKAHTLPRHRHFMRQRTGQMTPTHARRARQGSRGAPQKPTRPAVNATVD